MTGDLIQILYECHKGILTIREKETTMWQHCRETGHIANRAQLYVLIV